MARFDPAAFLSRRCLTSKTSLKVHGGYSVPLVGAIDELSMVAAFELAAAQKRAVNVSIKVELDDGTPAQRSWALDARAVTDFLAGEDSTECAGEDASDALAARIKVQLPIASGNGK